MYKSLYAGFDTLDVAFAGALPAKTLTILEQAREEAQNCQGLVLATIGPGNVRAHVYGHGMRGGYAYILDTGPLGCIFKIKNNTDTRQWNIFASPSATALLAFGYKGIRDLLFETLESIGAKVTDHSINRADFAMDFQTHGFELQQNQFVAHSHTKVGSHWGILEDKKDGNQPSTVMRGRRLESVTIGKQPGRQIIVYDKRRETIEKQKYFWFDTWRVDRNDPSLEVWRVEVRAGKKELKDKYQIRRFSDFEDGIGDVIVNALQVVRYIAGMQQDSNITRQQLHPLWIAAQSVAGANLTDLQSGLTPDQIVEIERSLAIDRYSDLCVGNAIGLGVSMNLNNKEIIKELPNLATGYIENKIKSDGERIAKSIQRARDRLQFVGLK